MLWLLLVTAILLLRPDLRLVHHAVVLWPGRPVRTDGYPGAAYPCAGIPPDQGHPSFPAAAGIGPRHLTSSRGVALASRQSVPSGAPEWLTG